jgi:hypothetical protein
MASTATCVRGTGQHIGVLFHAHRPGALDVGYSLIGTELCCISRVTGTERATRDSLLHADFEPTSQLLVPLVSGNLLAELVQVVQ